MQLDACSPPPQPTARLHALLGSTGPNALDCWSLGSFKHPKKQRREPGDPKTTPQTPPQKTPETLRPSEGPPELTPTPAPNTLLRAGSETGISNICDPREDATQQRLGK